MERVETETRAEALDLIDGGEAVWPPTAEVDPVFGSHFWLKAWWRYLALPTDRLRITVLHEGERPIGAACLYLTRRRWGPLTIRKLKTVGWSASEYVGLHLPPATAAIQTLFEALSDHGEWDVFCLNRLPRSSGWRQRVIETAQARGWLWLEEPEQVCPYLILHGKFEEFMQTRFKSKFRNRIRRMTKRLAGMGRHRFELVRQTGELPALLDKIRMLEGRSWKGAQGLGIFSTPEKDRFYRDVAQSLMERGRLALHLQWLDEHIIAYHFGFIAAGRYYDYNLAFDPDFEEFSPGLVSLYDLLERCWDLGLERFDFLRGNEPYKKLWTDTATQNINLLVFPPTARGRLLYTWRCAYHRLRAWKQRIFPRPQPPQFLLDPDEAGGESTRGLPGLE